MSIYRDYSEIELEGLLSNFLVNNWSFSAVAQFARNEKAYEMQYIYRERSKSGASSIAGNAYHHALRTFFYAFRNGEQFDLVDLEKFAFEYINERPAYIWKLQKTTPTIEDAIKDATKTVVALLRNFYTELSTYIDDIAEILAIEEKYEQFVTVNGVDIPLPCTGKIDMVVRTKSGKVAIVDHKSKRSFSDEMEMKLMIGTQAITYVKLFEAQENIQVDEVWFVENKYSQNKDKSAKQLNKFTVHIDDDTRRLYEVLLYEKLKRLVEAVSDPDYVYVINDSDNMTDMADLYAFWAKTQIAEVEDFPIDPSKKSMIAKRMAKIRNASLASINPKIIKNFKENAATFIQYDYSNKNMTNQEKITHVLATFGIMVQVPFAFTGYSSDTYLLEIGGGTKVASIAGHRLDIANALDVANIRISKELVMHEKRSYLSLDFAKERSGDLFFNPADLYGRKIPLGKDNFGNVIHWDLDNQNTPHMIVGGGTGSGKSVFVISVVEYALLGPIDEIVILDPKFEFTGYANNPKCKVYNEIQEIEAAMQKLVDRMDSMVKAGKKEKILVIFDEFADAFSKSKKGNELKNYELEVIGNYKDGSDKMGMVFKGYSKSLEENLQVLVQKGRSSGFRVLAALQRASTKIVNGDTKVNFPIQVCFRVQKDIDSRVMLDEDGAEKLAGRGDGLIKSPEYRDMIRFQSYYKP